MLTLVGTCQELAAPVVSQVGNVLHSDSPFGNRWLRNGLSIDGGIHAALEVTGTGYYQVMTLFGDCPSRLSTGISLVIDGVEDEAAFAVYPNPTTGRIFVSTGTTESESVHLVIRTTTGVGVASYEGPGGDVSLDLGGKAPGIYVVSITAGGRLVQRKLVVR